jgi:spore coat polysaccharide biosynthesis predicted glycosyltransferase SpsG
VLVTLGGGDPDNQTLKVIRALRRIGLKDLQVKVVVGAANPHSAVLESASRSCSFPIQLVRDARNMAELMAWADLAVSAGGSTCWEMAFMGLPCVILVLAENQQGIAKGIGEAGSGVNLGWFEGVTEGDILDTLSNLLSDPSRLRALSNMAKGLIDGKGRERIVSVLQEYKGSPCRKGI